MQKEILNTELAVTCELFKRVDFKDFEYSYRGNFSQAITKRILSIVENNLKKFTNSASLQNRIYFIMVEGMQNITRHQDIADNELDKQKYLPIFTIQKKEDVFIVTTGNIVCNEKIKELKQKLNKVNKLSKDDLKKLHRLVLSTGEISQKGGAGLGLIEMVRRSGNQLLFDFEQVDNSKSYFYLQTIINTQSTPSSPVLIDNYHKSYDNTSIQSTQQLNRLLTAQRIFLNFNGFLNRKNIFSLLLLIKGQISKSSVSKKIYYITVEMLQNIHKHGKNPYYFSEGIKGIFHIGYNEKNYILSSGNYVKNDNVDDIKQRLDTVNDYTKDELNDYFNTVLLNQRIIDPKKIGLGFVDIRLKTQEKLEYDFVKVDNNFSFFSLHAFVNRKSNSRLI